MVAAIVGAVLGLTGAIIGFVQVDKEIKHEQAMGQLELEMVEAQVEEVSSYEFNPSFMGALVSGGYQLPTSYEAPKVDYTNYAVAGGSALALASLYWMTK